MRCRETLSKTLDWLERRPWLPAASFVAVLLVGLLLAFALLANASDSIFRFLPSFPDRLVVFIDCLLYVIGFQLSSVLFLVTVSCPILWLLLRRFGTAGRFALYALAGIGAGVILFAGIFFCGMMSLPSLDSAWDGRGDSPKLRQRIWRFGDGRYTVRHDARHAGWYLLIDRKFRKRPQGGTWEDRVLLEKITSWTEDANGLRVVTADGCIYELDYERGVLDQAASSRKGETNEGIDH